jgi:hypothetical protein
MKLNIQIELDIKEFALDDKKLHGVLGQIADKALETEADKDITDIILNQKKIGWWNISHG